jgi:hypothetical protein
VVMKLQLLSLPLEIQLAVWRKAWSFAYSATLPSAKGGLTTIENKLVKLK